MLTSLGFGVRTCLLTAVTVTHSRELFSECALIGILLCLAKSALLGALIRLGHRSRYGPISLRK